MKTSYLLDPWVFSCAADQSFLVSRFTIIDGSSRMNNKWIQISEEEFLILTIKGILCSTNYTLSNFNNKYFCTSANIEKLNLTTNDKVNCVMFCVGVSVTEIDKFIKELLQLRN